MHESKAGVDVEGWEAGLVAVVLGTVVNVGGAGRVVVVGATVVIVARCAVLGIEAVPAWVAHELAVAVAEASRVVCAVVVVVVGGTEFAAVEGVSIVGLNDVGAGVVRGTKGTERWRLW